MIYQRHHSIEISDQNYLDYFKSVNSSRSKCFNVGSGVWSHDFWTNIDLPPQSKEFAKIQSPCLFHDLVKDDELPIENNSAELIFTSHVIEHLLDIDVIKLFKSAYRSLKPGGIIRVVTGPDADTDFQALQRDDRQWWYFYDEEKKLENMNNNLSSVDCWIKHLATPRSIHSTTPCDKKYTEKEINELIEKFDGRPDQLRDLFTNGLEYNINTPGDHLSWWNAEKLVGSLKQAGFSIVEKSGNGQSKSVFMRDLRFFDLTFPQISLYVEAVKT